MELKRNLILTGIERLSKGTLENAAFWEESIVLEAVAGQHMPYGSYTSPEFVMPPFSSLCVSWNASTPGRTVVEVQCRVLAAGGWSGWMSFGKWSPEYPRRSVSTNSAAGNSVFCVGDTVTVASPGGGTAVQLRVNLFSDDVRETPAVRLLAAAARPLEWERQNGQPTNRDLFFPVYNLQQRDTSFGASMDLPVTLAGLMNCYGEDVLPEELAFGMSDGATATCRNASFAAAMAGCCGHSCWVAWMDLRDLRAELHSGRPVGVELGGNGHWVGLHGFRRVEKPFSECALLCDPAASPGEEERAVTLNDFLQQFTGRALVLRRKARHTRASYPRRFSCTLRAAEPFCGEYTLLYRGDPWLLPDGFDGWMAASPYDGVAHATTAARRFVRLEAGREGRLRLPAALWEPGLRGTVYVIDATGAMRVAELRLPISLPKPPERVSAASALAERTTPLPEGET